MTGASLLLVDKQQRKRDKSLATPRDDTIGVAKLGSGVGLEHCAQA